MQSLTANQLSVRMRRLRSHSRLRDLVREVELSISDMVMPLFICQGDQVRQPISSMPGQYQLSVDQAVVESQRIQSLGLPAVILFGLPSYKDATGSAALDDEGVIHQAIRQIKQQTDNLLVIADLCLCEYTDHGHCGVINESHGRFDVDNDQTLALLARQAVSLAQAGADVIAPSGMMDGVVGVIRQALDQSGFTSVVILSYAVKFCSSFYGPFREAADGAPQFGDRSSYQMDPANATRALREAQLDVEEGADILMVKPAGSYLDIVARVKQAHPGVPLAAYQVSGEYAMIKAASAQGWLDEQAVMMESLLSIKRAGADFIITYFAVEAALLLSNK